MRMRKKRGLVAVLTFALVLSLMWVLPVTKTSRAEESGELLQNRKFESGSLDPWVSTGGFSIKEYDEEDLEPGENKYYVQHLGSNTRHNLIQYIDISSIPTGAVFNFSMGCDYKEDTWLELHLTDKDGKDLDAHGGQYTDDSRDNFNTANYIWRFKAVKPEGAVKAMFKIRTGKDKQVIRDTSLYAIWDDKTDTTPTPAATAKATATPKPTSTSAENQYDVWLGSVFVTDTNKSDILGDGKASYDPSSKTLYLNGINLRDCDDFTNTDENGNKRFYRDGIHASESITIHLSGSNYINTPGMSGKDRILLTSVACQDSITFTGDGSLNITAGAVSAKKFGVTRGIMASNSIIQKGGTINIVAEDASDSSYGVGTFNGSYTISGNSVLTAYGKNDGVEFKQGISYGDSTLVKAGSSGTDITFTETNPAYSSYGEKYKYVEMTCGGSGTGTTPTAAPVTTPTPTSTPGGVSTDIKYSPTFTKKWTNNKNVYNVKASNGAWVKVKALNKKAKSKSIKWIKNGYTAKVRFKKRCKKGKYKFRFSTAATADWNAGSTTVTITVS